jgi:hypothetical protein
MQKRVVVQQGDGLKRCLVKTRDYEGRVGRNPTSIDVSK